ncbi:outer membrane beta-barrel protein [Siphonobacter sp. SORGH_AS_1065]|uniref:outer membrane beta-barrel protein n=1 Tax=Siphonobacter sp. SORGH_AS_1065 TaxID=3041795 RepID=UPI002787E324|nr:outer membrane beta-barrel protein [Siphonobacter sp. SORGH_AS_1065]MDQ1086394.1 hypothetical protein [Siphonobacter sp. SORGH_AS_1065]
MSQQEPNDFEERWRKAFEEASESPSDELWDRLEQKLPPEQPMGLPLFWIGTVLLFLVGSLGWWYFSQSNNTPMTKNRPVLAQSAHGKVTSESPKVPARATTEPATRMHSSSATLKVEEPFLSSGSESKKAGLAGNENQTDKRVTRKKTNLVLPNSTQQRSEKAITRPYSQPSTVPTFSIQPTASTTPAKSQPLTLQKQETITLQDAQGKSWTLYTVGKKLTSPAIATAPALLVKPKSNLPLSKHWIAFHASWANFDPAVSTSGQYTSAFYSYAPAYSGLSLATAQPQTNTYRNSSHISYLLELTGGTRLSRHWYLETGAQYLKGHSIMNNNIILTGSNYRNTLYNQLLSTQKNSRTNQLNFPSPSNPTNDLNSVSVGGTNQFRYSFDFLSVPVSIGYNFRPEKRLNYFATAGLTLDFFLKNVLVDNSYEDIPPAEYGPKDGVYRNINTSTQAAIGANYRIFKKTSLNLKAFARKSLMGGIREGDYMQIRPMTVGVGLGIRRDL